MAIHRMAASDKDFVKLRALLANAIVGQMLPNGAVKGGTALKFRFGDAATRFTTDLDAARQSDLDAFVEKLEASLSSGWNGFAGRLVPRSQARPAHVPPQYVMRPFDIKIDTVGNHGAPSRWKSDTMSWAMPTSPNACFHQISHACFESLGFPIPTPCPSCRSTIKSLRNCTGQANREANGPTTSSISKSLCEERRLTRP